MKTAKAFNRSVMSYLSTKTGADNNMKQVAIDEQFIAVEDALDCIMMDYDPNREIGDYMTYNVGDMRILEDLIKKILPIVRVQQGNLQHKLQQQKTIENNSDFYILRNIAIAFGIAILIASILI